MRFNYINYKYLIKFLKKVGACVLKAPKIFLSLLAGKLQKFAQRLPWQLFLTKIIRGYPLIFRPPKYSTDTILNIKQRKIFEFAPQNKILNLVDICLTCSRWYFPWWYFVKVTVYLQRCFASKRCSASVLNRRYLNPYIKLELIKLAFKLYWKFWIKMNF